MAKLSAKAHDLGAFFNAPTEILTAIMLRILPLKKAE
jgi:hypothetical protein